MSTPLGEVLLAMDVGTSGARAIAFDLNGNQLLEVRRSYPMHSPHPGWAEQDGRTWRSAALSALAGALNRLGPKVQVLGISMTGQCPSVVPVDDHGEPVGPGLLYRDNRATEEAAAIREQFGEVNIHHRTGHLPAAFHIAPKILWLRRHAPDIFNHATHFLQPRDLATDGTHAAATLLFDLRRRCWDPDIFAALDLDHDLLPPIRPAWEVVGELRPALLRRFRLAGPIPVVLGGADSQTCAFGAGVIAPGPVSEMAGSSTCLNAAVEQPLDDVEITHYTHVIPGPFTTETGINTTGAAVEWLVRLIYSDRRGRPVAEDYARLDAEAGQIPPGSDGVIALPVLGDGERNDADLRAAIIGLSQRHDRAVLARAFLEGIAFAIRGQIDLLRRNGANVNELRLSGGDARLITWNQIKADVTGLPVVWVPGDAAVTGVAMLAGLGTGVYRGIDEAIARCVRLETRFEPNASTEMIYEDAYAAYQTLVKSSVVRYRAKRLTPTHRDTES
jgi:xylulokinase